MMERYRRRLYRSTFGRRARNLSNKRRRINDMKNRTLIFGTAALLAVLVAVPFAYAQHRRARGMAMHGGPAGELGAIMMLGHLEHAREALGLSDQQVADIKGIFKSLHEQNAAYHEQLHDGVKSIAETLLANPNDIAAAQALLDKQEAAEHTMKANALNAAAKALNVLTAEQRNTLAQHLRDRAERFQKMR
jgi:Spy/CpxP family protein refolding chaperone